MVIGGVVDFSCLNDFLHGLPVKQSRNICRPLLIICYLFYIRVILNEECCRHVLKLFHMLKRLFKSNNE